jgi:sigma-B regulation protein RsbU (phosphoserine phosphatase)
MKLRWKFFFILLIFSLIPLGLITVVNRQAIRRMEAVISEDVRQNVTPLAKGVLKLTAEDAAVILEASKKTFELALTGLVYEAEVVLSEEPPAKVKLYHGLDYDDPSTAPSDAGPHPAYWRKSTEGRYEQHFVSFQHPVFVVAPEYSDRNAAADIDRLSLLTESFSEISAKIGTALHWVYVSTESGVHMSFPGHGGFPSDYDPRRRSWYRDATDEIRWSMPYVDASSGQVIMTVSKKLRYPGGAPAGAAGMDILLTEFLRSDALASFWRGGLRAFVVEKVINPQTLAPELQIVAQKDYQSLTLSWMSVIMPERLTAEDPAQMSRLISEIGGGQSGHIEMPYQGVPSIWAFAPLHAQASFIVIVPREIIERLPEKIVSAVRVFTTEELWIMASTALAAVLLSILAALWGSRGFTRPMVQLVEASNRLSRGDFGVRVDLRTGDERDHLIQAFNDMVPKLEEHLRMRHSLQLANEIQQNLLPQDEPIFPGLDIAGSSLYCDETGGDYFDFLNTFQASRGTSVVVVGDVSGHGVHAALLMASARAALRLRASLPGSLAAIVADVNRQFIQDVGASGAFMTLFLLSVDGIRKTARWVRAGHDPALYFDPASGRFEEMDGRGAPLGMEEGMLFEEQRRAELSSGGILFLGTDGIWETTNPQGQMFGKQRLREMIRALHSRSAREIIRAVNHALEAHREGVKPSDDVTMVVVKIL